ncbi:MAG: hypothetical protein FWD36_00140 [Treponema sp.]|nr:hypothetical protein [Treponema sp.]
MIKIGASNWGIIAAQAFREAFFGERTEDASAGSGSLLGGLETIDFGGDVYNVYYGLQQIEQAFCFYIHTEMTYPLDVDEYLEIVGEALAKIGYEDLQINYTINTAPWQKITLHAIPVPVPVAFGTPVPLSGSVSLTMGANFLHTEIGEGALTINLYRGGVIVDNIDIIPNITITQADIPSYPGLFLTATNASTHLNGQHINTNPVQLGGSISLEPKPGAVISPETLEMRIEISLTLLERLHWRFDGSIRDELNPEVYPISLKHMAPYVEYIDFDEKEEGDETIDAGIGIYFHFDEMVSGLELAISCNTLNIFPKDDHEVFADAEFKPLVSNMPIVFSSAANHALEPGDTSFDKDFYRLDMPDGEIKEQFINEEIQFEFRMELRPAGGGDVLTLENIRTDIPPKIMGEARFFQNWRRALINMNNAVKAATSDDEVIIGKKNRIPNTEEGIEDPIDLSLMDKYITGFTFENIKGKLYLHGPNKTIADINAEISFFAYYNEEQTKIKLCEERSPLVLDNIGIAIDDYLSSSGAYASQALPDKARGTEFELTSEFNEIFFHMPEDLFFEYIIDMPEFLPVYPHMFTDGPGSDKTPAGSKIVATIMIYLPMVLVAVEDNARVMYPDMFGENAKDLFGRESENENLIPASLDLEYMRFSVDFATAMFAGGKLFLEKNTPILFDPLGIPVNGRTITLDLSRNQFDVIKDNLIEPDFYVEFNEGSKITIPRNLGVTSVGFTVKGKYELEL